MRRWLDLALVVTVVAIVAAFGARLGRVQPPPGPGLQSPGRPGLYDPQGPPLTFNLLKPGDTVAQAEQRYGRPDFSNPTASFQQWENPLTQVKYNDQKVLVEVGGSGLGVVRQGDRELFRCGQPEEDIRKVFGPPLKVEDKFYFYPGMKLHCGSQEGDKRWVSAVILSSGP